MTQKNFVKTLFQNFAQMLKDTAKIVKQDTIYGTQIGKIKIKEIQYEHKKLQKLIEIGRKTYFLYKKGEIQNPQLKELCKQLSMLENNAKVYHRMPVPQETKNKLKL